MEVGTVKVLVIGGTGFIGKNLLEAFSGAYRLSAPPRSELDIYDGAAVEAYLRENYFDIILNASDYRPQPGKIVDGQKMAASRLRGFCNLIRCKNLYGKMIFFGSGAEYGRELPICNIAEDAFDRIIPQDEYGFCLHTMTRFAMLAGGIVNLRLFGIFGKYEQWRTRFISGAVCKALYGYPITIRQNTYFDFLSVDDLTQMVKWAMHNQTNHCHYNAVSGRRYSLLELAELVREITGADVPIFIAREGMGKEYTASNVRISKEMGGFDAQPMRESIKNLCCYYKENIDQIDSYNLLYQ